LNINISKDGTPIYYKDWGRGSIPALEHAGEGVFTGASDRLNPPIGVRKGLAPWRLHRVLTHIEANLDTQIRNKDLAAVAGLSLYHFNVAFRNSVGAPPHGYIMRRRVERAQGLMLTTEKPLSEIAIECGLADQPHLTRLFRRMVGVSPAAWRRARFDPASVMTAGSCPIEA